MLELVNNKSKRLLAGTSSLWRGSMRLTLLRALVNACLRVRVNFRTDELCEKYNTELPEPGPPAEVLEISAIAATSAQSPSK